MLKSFFVNIKNLTPYLILISIYFFFINIEARNNINNRKLGNKEYDHKKDNLNTFSVNENKPQKIAIPVIPFVAN